MKCCITILRHKPRLRDCNLSLWQGCGLERPCNFYFMSQANVCLWHEAAAQKYFPQNIDFLTKLTICRAASWSKPNPSKFGKLSFNFLLISSRSWKLQIKLSYPQAFATMKLRSLNANNHKLVNLTKWIVTCGTFPIRKSLRQTQANFWIACKICRHSSFITDSDNIHIPICTYL